MYYPYTGNQQIIQVTGEAGARALQMMPNCSALLLDETAPIVWLAQTDGAGYKTVTPYKIEKYTPEPEPSIKDLMARITRLEEQINESYSAEVEPRKPASSGRPAQTTHERRKPEPAVSGADE